MNFASFQSTTFWTAVFIGAVFIGSLSAGMTYYQSEPLKMKAVCRDSLIGGIFVAILWQLVPESMQSFVGSLPTVDHVFQKVSGGDLSADFDLQVGPPNF